MTQTRTPAWTLGHGEPAEETYDQKCERLRLAGAVELSRRSAELHGMQDTASYTTNPVAGGAR